MLIGASFFSSTVYAIDIVVAGSGNVGVGTMNGGTIQFGISEAQFQQAMKASGQKQSRLIREMVVQMNAQMAIHTELGKRAAYT